MKKIVFALLAAGCIAQPLYATDHTVVVDGDVSNIPFEVVDGIYHNPQTMLPGHPTAATIWPRVVEVPCVKVAGNTVCEPINWTPKMGRGEYLYFKPVVMQPPAPPTPPVPVYIPVPTPVLQEVPIKKGRE